MPRTTSVVRKSQSKKVTKKAPRTARSSKRSAATRRPKAKPARRKTKRIAKKNKVVKVVSAVTPIVAPTVQTVPLPTPVMPVANSVNPTPSITNNAYKTLPDVRSRSKVWLAVTATSAIIMVVWLYTLQKSWLTIPQTVTESVENSNVEALVSNIEEQLSSIQSSAEVLSNQTEPLLTSPSTETTTNTSTPSGDLNNLFSDLQ